MESQRQTTRDGEQDQTTVKMMLQRTGDGLQVTFDDPACPWSVPPKVVIDHLVAETDKPFDELVRATSRGEMVGHAVYTKQADYVTAEINPETEATWKKYYGSLSTESKSRYSYSPSSAGTQDEDDTDSDPIDDEDFLGSSDDGEETDDDVTPEYEFEARIAAKETTAGGRSHVEVGVNGTVVSADIACPDLAHKSDHDLFTHVCKQVGRDPAGVVRGAGEGEIVARFLLSKEGVEGFTLSS